MAFCYPAQTYQDTTALFITAKRYKQPERPSIDDWINKKYVHTMECYPVIKRNKVLVKLLHG